MRIRVGRAPWLLAAAGLLLSGCAKFDDSTAAQTFTPAPQLSAVAGPQPQLPEIDGSTGGNSGTPQPGGASVPPPQGCTDYDKAVIATCLDTVTAVAALPGDGSTPSALAGERKSGRVMVVTAGTPATVLTTLQVDATGDGGLTGLALSPTYTEDQLVFAYITTATDNRVVRFTEGQQPKPILTGIPKGATGNRGALTTDGKGALLVATGDAGNPAAAADPNSLAGKILRIDTSGAAAQGNPTAGSRTFATGVHSPGGLCKAADGSRVWLTDRADSADVLYKVQPGSALSAPTWTWPDKPGVAGCADGGASVMVGTSVAGNVQQVPVTADGAVDGQPKAILDGQNGVGYGRYGGMDPISSQYAVVGTVNKDGGTPVSSDDRVVVIQLQPSPNGGSGKD